MALKQTKILTIAACFAVFVSVCGLTAAAVAKEVLVDPHWSDSHCSECHLDPALTEDRSALRESGDIVKLCNRCHQKEYSKTDIHPVNVKPSNRINISDPARLPLDNGQVTCLTCHDIRMQMQVAPSKQFQNPFFLRIKENESLSEFCMACHNLKSFKKINPHLQLSESGVIIPERCLFCHQSIPRPDEVAGIEQVSFVAERTDVCISCHSEQAKNHPARHTHLVDISPGMGKRLMQRSQREAVELPVQKGKIICGTCHNPHQKGVIQRQAAAAGAGEPFALRLPGGRELCTACHGKDDFKLTSSGHLYQMLNQQRAEEQHKPYVEQKCKACHVIGEENRWMPDQPSLCFQSGCHSDDIVKGRYRHEDSVLMKCTACHNVHRTSFGKLLRMDEALLCSHCHPLLRDFEGNMKSTDHQVFEDILSNSGLPVKSECYFCHNKKHKNFYGTVSPSQCAYCHIEIQKVYSMNDHAEYIGKKCSDCHEAHASPHPFQLKEPVEAYGQ